MPGYNIWTTRVSGTRWAPDAFAARCESEHLEFRAYWGTGISQPTESSTNWVRILRLQSNADVMFYGELILHHGGIRSFQTFGVTSLNGNNDIASFRSGAGPGDEKLRILSDGTLWGGIGQNEMGFKSFASSDWPNGAFQFDTSTSRENDAPVVLIKDAGTKILSIEDHSIVGTLLRGWGTNGSKLLAKDNTNTLRKVVVEGDTIDLKCSSGTVEILTDSSLYSDGFIGPKTVTADPGGGDGAIGAICVDTRSGSERLWVKTGSSSWKSVSLT